MPEVSARRRPRTGGSDAIVRRLIVEGRQLRDSSLQALALPGGEEPLPATAAKREQRNSDLTIGDFWGVQRVLPNLQNTRDGVSVVVTSTSRGEEFFSQCSDIEKSVVDSGSTQKVLKGYLDTRSERVKRDEIDRMKHFDLEYGKYGFNDLKKKYPAPTTVGRIIESIKFRLGIK